MKTVIIALNSKYIHSALAPWYLKASCGDDCGEVKVMEFTINDSLDSILSCVYRERPDVAAFSCYIWNVEHVLKLAENLKKASPNIKIILGGPEVSFDYEAILISNRFIDFIIPGEGERAFPLLLQCLCNDGSGLEYIDGVVYTNKEKMTDTKYQVIESLDSIPSPYTNEMLTVLKGRIVYFESSRGCPFSCSYCLSSTFEGVRYFSMERVLKDLERIINAGVSQVKFVDRTFNCSRRRAKDIFRFIISKGSGGISTNFHFEAAADLFDDEMLDILSGAPVGLIQFEIGIQTTNERTLEAIKRKTDLDKLFDSVRKLKKLKNMHLHVDLIAGLPEENMESFKVSFDNVYSLIPHQLQLGFLKMLKGSEIRRHSAEFEYKFRSYPPYEVISSRDMSFENILVLKDIEEMVERYYNSGRFINFLEYAANNLFASAFEFYEKLSVFYRNSGYMDKPPSSRLLYTVLMDFISNNAGKEESEIVNELLKLDFLASDNSNNMPEGLMREFEPGLKEKCFEFLKNREHIAVYLKDFEGVPAKQIYKQVHFEIFNYDVTKISGDTGFKKVRTPVLFNYSKKDRVTGLYEFKPIYDYGFVSQCYN